ncbi:AfsR/SARP family transcriptional regulator [Streptomyces sulfonofaciens]|uniref:AfsR/SARP family transcriptional regulator n=1 Tax=Streptomyces sulfonofaciens TaxID=68272 RepID=UPI001E5BCF9B|nr:tetratricopeptide repeat protein [Streptomyces sulfonofaciens]
MLGPVVALQEGVPIRMKSVKACELLAVLLLAPGHRVSHAGITRYLWPNEEPNANRIRQCFHQLRQSVPGIAERNERGFCRIRAAPHSVDYVRFRESQRAANATDSRSVRLRALRSALDEWRGTPLDELPGEGFEQKRAELVAELHDATAACTLAELECGQARAALDRVDPALARWPESETLLGLKVRALRTLGRQDQIEALLARWQRRFGRPTVHLLLVGEEDMAGPATADASPAPASARPRPRQLPQQSVDLVGRQPQLDQLAEIVLGRTAGRSRIAVITGMPGVGKTFLAVRAAAGVERNFPDGILYADLGGFSPGKPEDHGPVLATFLNDLRVRPVASTVDGLVAAYRTALADRAVLLILDNARDEDHVRPLLPPAGASAALVTSRRQLYGLAIRESAEIVDLAPLDRQDAVSLLRGRLGEARMGAVLPFVGDLVEHCAGVPLALGIMAARIMQRPGALAGMVRDLRQDSTRLRSLDLGSENLSVRLSLEASHRLLRAPAARLLWQLAVHPGPTVSWAALRALEPDDAMGVIDAIDDLMRMSLVTEPVFERYSLHDLVRVYAGETAARQDESERASVMERALSFLLHNAWANDRGLDPGRRLPIGEPEGVEVASPASAADAMSWFETEYSTLTAAVRCAGEHGLDRYTWLLPMTLVTFQWRSGRHLDALDHLTCALAAAEREAAPADVAMVHRMLAGTHRGLGNLTQAMRELRSAVRVSEKNADIQGAALARHILGVLLRESGASDEALMQFTAALSAFERLGDPLGQGAALNGIGSGHYDLGRYDEGLEHCLRSLVLLEGTDDLNGRAHALFSLGRIRVARGEHDAAASDFERARRLYRSLAYGSREARTLVHLAEALRDAGRDQEAGEAMERAHVLLEGLGERDVDAAVGRLRCLP